MKRLEFTGKVKFNVFKLILSHLQNKAGIGHENVTAAFVDCHFLVFPFFKSNRPYASADSQNGTWLRIRAINGIQ